MGDISQDAHTSQDVECGLPVQLSIFISQGSKCIVCTSPSFEEQH